MRRRIRARLAIVSSSTFVGSITEERGRQQARAQNPRPIRRRIVTRHEPRKRSAQARGKPDRESQAELFPARTAAKIGAKLFFVAIDLPSR
jgi:hypothetical protein